MIVRSSLVELAGRLRPLLSALLIVFAGLLLHGTGYASSLVLEPCDTGPRFEVGARLGEMTIEKIEVCGTFVGDPKPLKVLIKSNVKSRPGERYDHERLAKDFEAVVELNRFERLLLEFIRGRHGIVVVFNVKENPRDTSSGKTQKRRK